MSTSTHDDIPDPETDDDAWSPPERDCPEIQGMNLDGGESVIVYNKENDAAWVEIDVPFPTEPDQWR